MATPLKNGLMPKSLVSVPATTETPEDYIRVARVRNLGFSMIISILKNHQLSGDIVIICGYLHTPSGPGEVKAKSIVKGSLLINIYYAIENEFINIYIHSQPYAQSIAYLIGTTLESTSLNVDLVAVKGNLPSNAINVPIS